jgi:release factor glutamine methyltransferase
MILENTINEASKTLKDHNIESHNLDAQILLSEIMGVSREFLISRSKTYITKEVRQKYYNAIKRRIKNEPIAYITGKREFWSHNFLVNSFTLVPRPETELLIYKIVNYFKNKSINILDIGTGSGCILLSILKELKKARGVGIDVSSKTIKIAKLNSNNLGLTNRSKFIVSDINKFNSGKYGLIVSNPPYIPYRNIRNLSKDIINYEPWVALNGGNDGLDLIKKVIYKSSRLLKKNGLLAIEIGNKQYTKVSNILNRFRFREIGKEYDNNKNVRCIITTKP